MPARSSISLPDCRLCHRHRSVVEEPVRANVMVIGEAPGKDEDRRGVPFVGRSGSELDRLYLPLAGLERPDIYVSNTVKCMVASSGKAPDMKLTECCSNHWLPWEIRRVKPEVIVTMGAHALKLFPGRSLELDHGIPFDGTLTRPLPDGTTETYWTGTVLPTYHPAAGLRSGDFMAPIMADMRALGRLLRGRLTIPTDPYPSPDYQILKSPREFQTYVQSDLVQSRAVQATQSRLGMGLDTEAVPEDSKRRRWTAYCLSLSLAPGTGCVVMSDDRVTLDEVFRWRLETRPLILMHNGLFDIPILYQMGLDLRGIQAVLGKEWSDTLVSDYHQGDLDKGLKIVSRRLLGVHMEDFDDVVNPYWFDAMVEYLGKVVDYPGKWPRIPRQVDLKKRAERLMDDLIQYQCGITPEPPEKPLDRWESIGENQRLAAESEFGEFPLQSIGLVPMDVLRVYASRDADVTLRLWDGVLRDRQVVNLSRVG